jgi:hypothetical protein
MKILEDGGTYRVRNSKIMSFLNTLTVIKSVWLRRLDMVGGIISLTHRNFDPNSILL